MTDKGEFDATPWIIGLGCLAGGIGLGYILPDIIKLLSPQPKLKENPNPKSKAETNPEIETETELRQDNFPSPHFTRDVKPQLSARFSHSSTTTDRQSLEQRLLNKQALERMDLQSRQSQARWRPKTPNLSVPSDRRLSYGSDGHSNVVSVQRPRETRPRWRLKKT